MEERAVPGWWRAIDILESLVEPTLERMPRRFTTRQFIEQLRQGADGEARYQDALRHSAEDELQAQRIVHGQVVPRLLRRAPEVQWAGYVYGRPEDQDGLAVPSWWEQRPPAPRSE